MDGARNDAEEPTAKVLLRHLSRYLSQFPDDTIVALDASDPGRPQSGAFVDLSVAMAHVRQEVSGDRSRRGPR